MRFAARLLEGTLGLVLLAGCTSREPADAPVTPTPDATGSDESAEESDGRKESHLPMPAGEDVSFAGEVELVERVRELEALRPVRGRVTDEDALVGHVEATFRKEIPERALQATETMLVGLGTAPLDFDLKATMLELLRSQLAGLYDPRLDTMFVRSELAEDERDAALFHELVHALQDQHYDLDEISVWKPDATDESSALSSLAEGDATSAMFDAIFDVAARESGSPVRTALDISEGLVTAQMAMSIAAEEGDPIPAVLRRSLIAPYQDGLRFVHALRRKGGWEAVDSAWKRPPTTTEQVLHVDKYLAAEPGLSVEPVGGPDPSFETLLTDVWGEQSLRLVLEEWVPPKTASESAAGWGGDRIELSSSDGAFAVSWRLLADDETSAERTFAALRRGLPGREPEQLSLGGKPERFGTWVCTERPELGPLAVGRRGRWIVVLAGPFRRETESSERTEEADCGETTAAWMRRGLQPN